MNKTAVLAMLIVCLGSMQLHAQVMLKAPDSASAPASRPGPRIVKMTVTPAPATRPAMKYRLLPPATQLVEGNAAQCWYVAGDLAPKLTAEQYRWLALSPDKLPTGEVTRSLDEHRFGAARRAARLAATRTYCHWDMLLDANPVALPLPSLGNFRELTREIILLARVEMAQAHYDEAIEQLQTTFALARDLAGSRLIIQGLVGVAVQAVNLEEIEYFIASPNSPNLYWALADMPRVDLRHAVETELQLTLKHFDLQNLRHLTLTAQESDGRLERIFKELAPDMIQLDEKWDEAKFVSDVKAQEQVARQYLLQTGERAERVRDMPASQAILVYEYELARDSRDDFQTILLLPFPRACVLGQRLENTTHLGILFGDADAGAASRPLVLTQRVNRQLDMLRTIEAIRMYAASHQGQPPERLADLTDTPAPVDPMFDRPFTYSRQGNSFVLEGMTHDPNLPHWTVRYEVTIQVP